MRSIGRCEMSRLQVGGLALVINADNKNNIGKVVSLIGYVGCYAWIDDGWEVGIENGINILGERTSRGVLSAKNLMPLGDKQTQDELSKEAIES